MAKTMEKAKKTNGKIQNLAQFAERCPFPFAVRGHDGAVQNFDSKELKGVLTAHRIRKLVSDRATEEVEEEMYPVKIGGIDCFVLTFRGSEGRIFVFMEDAVRHRDVTFCSIFSEGADCLEEWQYSDGDEGEPLSPAARSRLSAETRRVKEKMRLASRLYSDPKRKLDEPCVCGVRGYLDLASEKLRKIRTGLSVKGGEGMTAFVSPRFLLNAVLLFTQFAMLSGKEAKIDAEARREGKRVEISFSVERKRPVLREIALPAAGCREEFLPLLSLAMLCRDGGVDFDLRYDEKSVTLTLKTVSGDTEPQVFLGTRSRKEERMVESLIEEILFLNKKR